MTEMREVCPTCGAKKPEENEYCSDGFHAPGETFWPVTDTMRDKIARIERYIAEYEDASNWGGPTMYPAPPKISDLRSLLALIAPVMEENERYRAALERLSSSFTGGWAGMYRERADVIGEVEQIARAALSPKSEKQDG